MIERGVVPKVKFGNFYGVVLHSMHSNVCDAHQFWYVKPLYMSLIVDAIDFYSYLMISSLAS